MHPIEIIKAIIKCIHGLKRDGLFPEPRRYRMLSGTQEKTLCLLQGFSGLESEQFRRAGTKRNHRDDGYLSCFRAQVFFLLR